MKKILLTCLLLCAGEAWAQDENNGDLSDLLQPQPQNIPRVIDNNPFNTIPLPTYACPPEPFDKVAGVTLHEWSESKSFYFFETKMGIDVNGSPRAYHPQDKGLDNLKYTGSQDNWWGLVTDNGQSNGKPLLQQSGDPYPGYYISMTATVYKDFPDKSPARYIDSEKIPYFALNQEVMRSTSTQKGDIGYVYNRRTKKGCYAIFGDMGNTNRLGKGSIYLAQQLGINANPRTGGQVSDVVYMVFPFSGNGAARSLPEINAIGEKLMNKSDGFTFIKTCLDTTKK